MPGIDDWMAKVLKDLDSEKDTTDPGSPVMPCPKRAAAIVLMVSCPDDGKLLGGADVELSGASQKKDKTATEPAAEPLRAGQMAAGFFAFDLFGHAAVAGIAQTNFIYGFAGDLMAGPARMAVVTEDMLLPGDE